MKPSEQILEELNRLIPVCTAALFAELKMTSEQLRQLDRDLAAHLETAARVGAHLMAIGRYLDSEHERRAEFELEMKRRQDALSAALFEVQRELEMPLP
jgi:hypothetical protein